jgi:branched-subunit amino acid transport protein
VTPLTWTILGMAGVTYGVRLWGLLLPGTRLRGYGRRFLDAVPVAVFAALVAGGLPGADAIDGAWRIAAAAVTVVVVARTRGLAAGLLLGLGVYLAARALGWA